MASRKNCALLEVLRVVRNCPLVSVAAAAAFDQAAGGSTVAVCNW